MDILSTPSFKAPFLSTFGSYAFLRCRSQAFFFVYPMPPMKVLTENILVG
jgi:hypothetical protein